MTTIVLKGTPPTQLMAHVPKGESMPLADLITAAEDALAGRASLITALEQTTAALSEKAEVENDLRNTLAAVRGELRVEKAYARDLEDCYTYAMQLLDEEPLWLSLIRCTLAPVLFARAVLGAVRGKS